MVMAILDCWPPSLLKSLSSTLLISLLLTQYLPYWVGTQQETHIPCIPPGSSWQGPRSDWRLRWPLPGAGHSGGGWPWRTTPRSGCTRERCAAVSAGSGQHSASPSQSFHYKNTKQHRWQILLVFDKRRTTGSVVYKCFFLRGGVAQEVNSPGGPLPNLDVLSGSSTDRKLFSILNESQKVPLNMLKKYQGTRKLQNLGRLSIQSLWMKI